MERWVRSLSQHRGVTQTLSLTYNVDVLAAGELFNAEPEHADQHHAAAVQPADLQSSRLPRRGQHGAQVRGQRQQCPTILLQGNAAFPPVTQQVNTQ